MKVIIPCKFLQTVHSKAKENREACTYHTVLCDVQSVLIKDKDNKLVCNEPMTQLMLECYVSVYNNRLYFNLKDVL